MNTPGELMVVRRNAFGRRGEALVEYALLMGLFWLLIFGIIEFGRLVFTYNSVANIAREGARYGIMHRGDSAGVEEAARALAPALDQDNLTITVTWSGVQNTVNVQVNYPVNLITGFLIQALGGTSTVNVRAEATMQVEG